MVSKNADNRVSLIAHPTPEIPLLPPSQIPPSAPNYSTYISALSNFAIQYNMSVMGIALILMDNSAATDLSPAFPRTSSQESLLKSSVFAGAVVGQAVMGYAGDAIGRGRAMILTNAFTCVGAVASALGTWGSSGEVYDLLIFYRFILGIGVGGKYPLASTIRAEGTTEGQNRGVEVAKGFFWQTPGSIFPYVVAWSLVAIAGQESAGAAHVDTVELQFRLLFGLGALPSVIVMLLTYLQFKDAPLQKVSNQNPLRVAAAHPELWRRLVGTSVTWFLYDFVYYGTALSQPEIVQNVFGSDSGLFDNCWHNIVLACIGVPGVVVAILQLEWLGNKQLMAYGFAMIGVVSFVLGYTLTNYADYNWLNFGVTCALIFSVNWGCNIATYVLPIDAFPAHARSSFYGLSAACGKIGAFAGGYLFTAVSDKYGYGVVYFLCGVLSVVGVGVSLLFVEPYGIRCGSGEAGGGEEAFRDESEEEVKGVV